MAILELEFQHPVTNPNQPRISQYPHCIPVLNKRQFTRTFSFESNNFLMVNINSAEGTVPSVSVCKTWHDGREGG